MYTMAERMRTVVQGCTRENLLVKGFEKLCPDQGQLPPLGSLLTQTAWRDFGSTENSTHPFCFVIKLKQPWERRYHCDFSSS